MIDQARFSHDLAIARCTIEESYKRKDLIKEWKHRAKPVK
jgi:hypothetical protein